jgi:methionyl-tRNA formyltransferase
MVGIEPLRLVFFGTPDFARPTLESLLRSRHQVVGVITQPDRPRGRGHHTTDAPVKELAVAASVPVLQPERLRDARFLAALTALGADLGVVAAYGKILPEEVLAVPRLGLVNVHGSLLPRYRGAAPVHRAVMAGERETGVTIMRVVRALDAGPMLAIARQPIDPNERSDEVEARLARVGARLLLETVDALAAGAISERPQDETSATYAPRLTKQEGLVDWTWPADRVHNLIRGLHPWPLAYSFLNGRRVILRRSRIAKGEAQAAPGTVLAPAGHRLVIATASDGIDILEIQPENKRPMTAREFLAGHSVAPGDRFSALP